MPETMTIQDFVAKREAETDVNEEAVRELESIACAITDFWGNSPTAEVREHVWRYLQSLPQSQAFVVVALVMDRIDSMEAGRFVQALQWRFSRTE